MMRSMYDQLSLSDQSMLNAYCRKSECDRAQLLPCLGMASFCRLRAFGVCRLFLVWTSARTAREPGFW